MKINDAQLSNLIKEEINNHLREIAEPGTPGFDVEAPERSLDWARERARERGGAETASSAEKAGRAFYAGDDKTYQRIRSEIGDEPIEALDADQIGHFTETQIATMTPEQIAAMAVAVS